MTGPPSKALAVYGREVVAISVLEKKEEAMIPLSQAGRDRAVLGCLRLVLKIANEYVPQSSPLFDELVSEGNIGLVQASKRFDPSRNVRFASYAQYWIRAMMLAHLLRGKSVVRMGRSAVERRILWKLFRDLRAGYTVAEIEASFARENEKRAIREASGRLGGDTSIDIRVGEKGRTSLADMTVSDAESPEEIVTRKDTSLKVRKVLSRVRLSPRERMILDLRMDRRGGSRAQIAREIGVSRQRVDQIEKKLLGKLGAVLARSGFREQEESRPT